MNYYICLELRKKETNATLASASSITLNYSEALKLETDIRNYINGSTDELVMPLSSALTSAMYELIKEIPRTSEESLCKGTYLVSHVLCKD